MVEKSFFTASLSPRRLTASRRLASVFFFAYVTRRSTNGRTAFAFASVVEMRSSSTSERASERRSARRWFVSRWNVCAFLVNAMVLFALEREAVAGERFQDLLDRLVADAVELLERARGLAHESGRRLYARLLKRGRDARGEAELGHFYLSGIRRSLLFRLL